MNQPTLRPKNPNFSSGPCTKRPGWSLDVLESGLVGRSHRSADGLAKLQEAINQTRKVLDIPEDYKLAIVPGSATGAMEMAFWSLLGPRAVDVFSCDVFGGRWVNDVVNRLQLPNVRVFEADYGDLPDLQQVNSDNDIVFVWNATSSGVWVPDGNWLPRQREGLVFCDAVSAVFVADLPWEQLDVTAFSWQKALGGEAGQGMLVLSPRALARLESYTPKWPVPGLFRLDNENIFCGVTNSTPSLLEVEDFLDALSWAERIGGMPALRQRVQNNFNTISAWVEKTDWVEFLAKDPASRSPLSVCLTLEGGWPMVKEMVAKLAVENVAFDIKGHKQAPANIRIWCGPTIETSDISSLLPWLEWSFAEVSGTHRVAC